MKPDRIRRAAEILREEARALQAVIEREHTGRATFRAMANRYDDMLGLAQDLDALADHHAELPRGIPDGR